MSKLSIFIDESGDFDMQSKHAPYYLITMIFHDQDVSIAEQVDSLNETMTVKHNGFNVIHAGPLIRREKEFKNLEMKERKQMFYSMYYFARKIQFSHKTFLYVKEEFEDKLALINRMSREIRTFTSNNLVYFQSFDDVVIYYDNGQTEINIILNLSLDVVLNDLQFKKVDTPSQYKLFQVADFVCTIELLKYKLGKNELSNSEKKFFSKNNELRKTFIKTIDKKVFKSV